MRKSYITFTRKIAYPAVIGKNLSRGTDEQMERTFRAVAESSGTYDKC